MIVRDIISGLDSERGVWFVPSSSVHTHRHANLNRATNPTALKAKNLSPVSGFQERVVSLGSRCMPSETGLYLCPHTGAGKATPMPTIKEREA